MQALSRLYTLVIYGKEKAVVAFVVSGVLSAVALVGVNGDMTVSQALTALGIALVSHLSVYLKANKG